MGLRSPRLPHAKGVLYQMSYDPKFAFVFFTTLNTILRCHRFLLKKKKRQKLEVRGFDPRASPMRTVRSTNWAKPPFHISRFVNIIWNYDFQVLRQWWKANAQRCCRPSEEKYKHVQKSTWNKLVEGNWQCSLLTTNQKRPNQPLQTQTPCLHTPLASSLCFVIVSRAAQDSKTIFSKSYITWLCMD